MIGACFTRVLRLADVPSGAIVSLDVHGWRVLVARVGENILALNDRCPHAGSPLSTGRLRHGTIMCPLHGARFDLASGKCLGGGYRTVRTFPVRLRGDAIEVAVPAELPGTDEAPLKA